MISSWYQVVLRHIILLKTILLYYTARTKGRVEEGDRSWNAFNSLGDGFVHTLHNNLRAHTYLQLAMFRLVSLGLVCLMFFQFFIQWFDLKYRICVINQSIPKESLWVRQKSAQSGGGGPIVWTFLYLGPKVRPLMKNNEIRLYVSTMIITNYTILRLFLD